MNVWANTEAPEIDTIAKESMYVRGRQEVKLGVQGVLKYKSGEKRKEYDPGVK